MTHSPRPIVWEPSPRGDGWEDVAPDAVLWLDVARLEASFRLDPTHYIGPGGAGAGQPGRYAKVGKFIVTARSVRMPHLGVRRGDTAVRFTDGRHRFAWVRDHGAGAIPVTTDPANALKLADLFGTEARECRVRIEA